MRPLPPPPPPYAVLSGAAAPTHARPTATWRMLGWVFGVVGFGVVALVLAAVIIGSTGVIPFFVGVLLASLPAVALVAAFLWVDRYEPEPPGLLVFAFAWGAVVAALVSAILNSVSLEVVASVTGTTSALTGTAVVAAPVVEEGTKALGVLLVYLARRREFDGVVDGIVCAGMVGVGFAFSENILYFGRAFLEGEAIGPNGGLLSAGAVFLLRGILSPFAHPMFTVAFGIGLGLAVSRSGGRAGWFARWAPALAGLVVAVALHSLWNLSAVAGFGGFFVGYAAVMVPLFLVFTALVLWVRTREGRLIARHLPAYVQAGWMPPYDVGMVATMAGRRRGRTWAGSYFGPAGERAMVSYQHTATELAFLRDRATRVVVPDFAAREQTLLVDLARERAVFADGPAFGG